MANNKSKCPLIIGIAVVAFTLLCHHSLQAQEPEVTVMSVADAFKLDKTGLDQAPWLSMALFSPDRIRLAIPFPDSIVIVDTTGSVLHTVNFAQFRLQLRKLYDWSADDKLLFHAEKPIEGKRGRTDSPAAYIYNLSKKELSLVKSPGLGAPRFSSDGNWIAFDKTDEENKPYLWVSRSDGTDEKMIASIGSMNPIWSHNGEMIAYRKWESGKTNLWLYHFKTNREERIHSPGVSYFAFSPTDSLLCFLGGRALFLMNIDEKEMRELVPYPNDSTSIAEFQWSPDGTRIAFVLCTVVGELGIIASSDIYLVRLDDSGIQKITDTPKVIESHLHWLDEETVVYILQ